MGEINFKNSNWLRHEFGESTKIKSPLLHLDDDKTGLDYDETSKINFKNSNCGGQEFGESMKTEIATPPPGR